MPIAVALLPAFVFLGALLLMDSFKLVRPASVALALIYGMISAIVCEAVHVRLIAASIEAYRTGIAAAQTRGDKQAAKEMTVFLRRLEKPKPEG